MNFELSEEDRAFADSVSRFAHDKLAEGALERAHSAEHPWEIAQLLANQGLLGIAFPEADGGQGGSLMHAVLAIQEIALVCPKSADIVQAGNFGPIRTFVEYASAEQKDRFLPDLLGGRKLISLGMTEPDAGSAVTELKTSARQDGGDYLINGSKIFSTHSPEAEVFLVYVRFGPGIDGIGSVLVERGPPGFTVGLMPSSMAPAITSSSAGSPALCPSIRGNPRWLAQRPLPSMTIATCCGISSLGILGGTAPEGCP